MWDTFFEQAVDLRARGEPFALATVVACQRPTAAYPGAKALIRPDGTLTGWVGGSCAQPTVIREALKAIQDGTPRLLRISPAPRSGAELQEGVYDFVMTCASQGALEIYVEPFVPPPVLLVIGETPVAQALARFGTQLDFTVWVSDPDVTRERFPDAEARYEHLEEACSRVQTSTYVVVATQGAYDEEALKAALATAAGYIGLVASTRRAAAILQTLRDQGVPSERLQRVTCPAGVQLGAVTPPEIAFSIMAEILQLRRRQASQAVSGGPVASPPAAAHAVGSEATDPVCGMAVRVPQARYTSEHAGTTFYFCCSGCKERFDRAPEQYAVGAHA
ncbi:MAG TPA: XdhC family protein [Candidatus Tectomicrobia bacterium]|jgi:xanthine dehydrogenase accessory factor